MTIKYTYLLILGLLFLSSSSPVIMDVPDNQVQYITTKTTFMVGAPIVLMFSSTGNKSYNLYCSYSHGTTLVSPTIKNNVLYYQIPLHISNKRSVVSWKLLETDLLGQIEVIPKTSIKTLETYIGPPTIYAGGIDFAMVVIIPTDNLDNPLKDSTLVNFKHQFLASKTITPVLTEHLIAYKNIYSPRKTGRILVSSECLDLDSKEYDINVLPAIPTNFRIKAERHHDYADGNQTTSFSTTVIRDAYNNIVIDGTFVDFFITNEAGNILKTSGNTVSGVATAIMIHPDYNAKWRIKAFVNGMAESNNITLRYKQVIKDFDIVLSQGNTVITVGPLRSFMKQMIPDGLTVTLSIYKENTEFHNVTRHSKHGYVRFNLSNFSLEKGCYDFSFKTAGLEKTLQSIAL